MYWMTGTIDPDGTRGGPMHQQRRATGGFRWTTYAERLEEAGVSWRVYQQADNYGCNMLEHFAAFQDAAPGDRRCTSNGIRRRPGGRVRARRAQRPAAGRLLDHPDQPRSPSTPTTCRPPARTSSPARSTRSPPTPRSGRRPLFILNYDENDGLFDHVAAAGPAAGTPGRVRRQGLPIGGGFRVPCIIVSPWTAGGWVCSEPFDHTSVLRFLERFTGVREPNISAWRGHFGDLTSALACAPPGRFPRLPETRQDFWRAEREVATLPAATLPGSRQTPPHRSAMQARPRHNDLGPVAAEAGASAQRTAAPPPAAWRRATTDRGDFPDGTRPRVPRRVGAIAGRRQRARGPRAYVPGVDGGNVAIVDPATHASAAVTKPGPTRWDRPDPGGAKLYVTNSGASDVSVIDVASWKVAKKEVVGIYPHGVAASPDGALCLRGQHGPRHRPRRVAYRLGDQAPTTRRRAPRRSTPASRRRSSRSRPTAPRSTSRPTTGWPA